MQLTPPSTSSVQAGYKQTEVGVIPEDWEAIELGQIAEIGDGIHSTPVYSINGEYFSINGNNLRAGKVLITNDTKRVDHEQFKLHGRALSDKSIFISINGTIGNLGLYDNEPVVLGKSAAYLNIGPNTSRLYTYNALQNKQVIRQFEDGLTGSTIKNLGLSTIRGTKIPLPPTKAEQEAIAGALSDADAWIESLEQLIAKKRRIKEGASQALLTGKQRLPGFEVKSGYQQTEVGVIPNDWEAPELGEILTSTQLGGNYKNNDNETNWPLIKMGNLGRGTIKLDKLEYIVPEQPPASRDRLEEHDVLFNTRNTLDLVGKVAIWRNELLEAYFNSNIMRMKFEKSRVSSYEFMNFILNTPQSLSRLRAIATGTTSVAAIYGRDLVKIRVPLPKPAEQTAIAEILSEMDAELDALAGKLSKARQIKQGMMQELLTGKTRLV